MIWIILYIIIGIICGLYVYDYHCKQYNKQYYIKDIKQTWDEYAEYANPACNAITACICWPIFSASLILFVIGLIIYKILQIPARYIKKRNKIE